MSNNSLNNNSENNISYYDSVKKHKEEREKTEKRMQRMNIGIIIFTTVFIIILFSILIYTRRKLEIIQSNKPSLLSITTQFKEPLPKETIVNVEYLVLPKEIKQDKLKWHSSNESVAYFEKGNTLKTINIGETRIYAELNGIKSNEYTVKVANFLEKIVLLNFPEEMKVGEESNIEIEYEPKDAINKELKITSSDDSIISIVDNQIKALKEGEVSITFKDSLDHILQIKFIKVNLAVPM